MRLLIAAFVTILVSGCAIAPREGPSCDFVRHQLKTSAPQAGAQLAGARGAPSTLADAVLRALAPRTRAATGRSADGSMLFLSGGGQHGAFGAGYLAEWKARSASNHLPGFTVVTGISTGAILSTFAFIDQPDIAAAAYAIRDEDELLARLVSVREGQPTTGGYIGMVKKGAIADLGPLRTYLMRVITEDILDEVAAAAGDGRLLLVGVVDVDTGGAVALDLTDMARREQNATDAAERSRLKACYIEAIVASSSAPMAALPVFIDHRMYIDGGARFGAFSDELGPILDRSELAVLARKPKIYLIVNGDQTSKSICGRLDRNLCLPPDKSADPPGVPTGAHAKWDFLKLALRSQSILANQVYRFSADSIAFGAYRRGFPLHYTQIEPDVSTFIFNLDDPVLGSESMTCADAQEMDRRLLDPIQFYPRYMRCLIAYGRARARTDLAGGDP